MLRGEGLEVTYQPPLEQRSAGEVIVKVVIVLLQKAADEAGGVVLGAVLSEAARKLKARLPHVRVTDEQGKEIE